MSFAKNLWSDLVEKRLWPVALVLLVALFAVPVLLRGPAEPTPAPVPPDLTGAAGAVARTAQVSLDPAALFRRDLTGEVRDPFEASGGRGVAQSTEQIAGAVGAPPSSASSDGGGGSAAAIPEPTGGGAAGAASGGGGLPDAPALTPTPSGPASPDPDPQQPAAPAADPMDSYVVVMRFAKTDAKRPKAKDVKRLTPLPSAEDPFLVHLGVLSDKKTAVFLLSSDVTATGDGACKPRKSSCETIELRRGDTEFLDVTDEDGEVTQYQLELLRVEKATPPSLAVAAREIAREEAAARKEAAAAKAAGKRPAKPGAEDDELGSDRYRYDEETGLLKRVKADADRRAQLRAAGDAAGPGLAGWFGTGEPEAAIGFGAPSAPAPQP